MTDDGHISSTIIPTGHVGGESSDASLHRVFLSCELLKGKDNKKLPTLFRDNLNDVYKDLLLNPDNYFQPLEEFIDTLITGITEAYAQDEACITIPF